MEKFNITESYKPKNFTDQFIPQEVTFENSQAVVVPYGYEGTVTFGHGTNRGPKALVEASWQIESFDDELLDDVQNQVKIWTTQQPKIPKDALKAAETLSEIVWQILERKKLPVVIGGEHSISYGFVQGLAQKYDNFGIVVFDSHLDLGDRYSEKDFTHAAWLKYSLELPQVKNATLFGIRNFNKIEHEYWQNSKGKVNVYLARDKDNWGSMAKIIKALPENIYLSFDIDAFDPSIMPATGTPEPGGLLWDETLNLIREISKKKNIIGMDLVELAPIKDMHAPSFIAAKLLVKMIMYAVKGKNL